MTSLRIFSNFFQIYNCHPSRFLCANAFYRFKPIRSQFHIQLQKNLPYCEKELKLYCPSSRILPHLPGLYGSESHLQLDHISYCTSTKQEAELKKPGPPTDSDLPSPEQLQDIEGILKEHIELFFISKLVLPVNGKTIVFINNLQGTNKTYRGALNFYIQKSLLKMYGHFHCLSVNVDTINHSTNIENGTVTIDWKLSYIPNKQIFKRITLQKCQELHGRCIAEVKNDGLIHSVYLERKVVESEPAGWLEEQKIIPRKNCKTSI